MYYWWLFTSLNWDNLTQHHCLNLILCDPCSEKVGFDDVFDDIMMMQFFQTFRKKQNHLPASTKGEFTSSALLMQTLYFLQQYQGTINTVLCVLYILLNTQYSYCCNLCLCGEKLFTNQRLSQRFILDESWESLS